MHPVVVAGDQDFIQSFAGGPSLPPRAQAVPNHTCPAIGHPSHSCAEWHSICTPAGSVDDGCPGVDRDPMPCGSQRFDFGVAGSSAGDVSAEAHHGVSGVAAGPLPPLHGASGIAGSASFSRVPNDAAATTAGGCCAKECAPQACSGDGEMQRGAGANAALAASSSSIGQEGAEAVTTRSLGSSTQAGLAAQQGGCVEQCGSQPRVNTLTSTGMGEDMAEIRSDSRLLPCTDVAGTELSRGSGLQKCSQQGDRKLEVPFHPNGVLSPPRTRPMLDTADSAGNAPSTRSFHLTKPASTSLNPISNAQLFASYHQQRCGSMPRSARDHQVVVPSQTAPWQYLQQSSKSGGAPGGLMEHSLGNRFVQDLIASRATLTGTSTPSSCAPLTGSARVPASTPLPLSARALKAPGSARVPPSTPRHSLPAPTHALSTKAVEDWSEADVAEWMTLRYPVHEEFLELLRRHAINGPVLLTLTEGDLNEMGIERFGHRRLLGLAIQEVRAHWIAQQPQPQPQAAVEPVVLSPVACGSMRFPAVPVQQSNSAMPLPLTPSAQQPGIRQGQPSVMVNGLFAQPCGMSSFQPSPPRAGQISMPVKIAPPASNRQTLRVPSATRFATAFTPRGAVTPSQAAQVQCANSMALVAPLASTTLVGGSSGAASPRVPMQDSKGHGHITPRRQEPCEPVASDASGAQSPLPWKPGSQLVPQLMLPSQQVVSYSASNPLSARFANTEVPKAEHGACVRQRVPLRLGTRSGPSLPMSHASASLHDRADVDVKLGSKVAQPPQPQPQYSGPALMVGCPVRKCISSEPEPEAGSLSREA